MRVLVVGAGPTGLTAAVELKRMGVDVEVIDKRDSASGFSRAVGILPASLSTLKPSGVSERLMDEGIRYRSVQLYRDTARMAEISLDTGQQSGEFNFILGLAQDRTENILALFLGQLGGKITYSLELLDFDQTEEQVTAQFSDGTKASYDYLIGADGIKSITREKLGLDYRGFELPEKWSIADVDADGWHHPDGFTVCQLPMGKVAVVAPLEQNRYRVISNTEDALEALPMEFHTTNIRRAGTFKISIRQVDHYSSGRVFLAGDSAHCHSPVGGRGMNLGIADAAELASRMVEGTMEQYSASRHEKGAAIIAASERARKVLTSKSRFTRTLVRLGLTGFGGFPIVQRQLANQVLYG